MHTCMPVLLLVTALCPGARTHVVRTPQPLPESWHMVPLGQQVYPLEQQTAFAPGQQPKLPGPGAHFCVQHVDESSGQAVLLYAGLNFGAPHVDHPARLAAERPARARSRRRCILPSGKTERKFVVATHDVRYGTEYE